MKHLNLDNTGAKWILLSDEWLSLFLVFLFRVFGTPSAKGQVV